MESQATSAFHFFSKANETNTNIQFTLEFEVNSSLPLLDVHLIKDNNTLKYTAYGKIVKINKIIPFSASVPFKYQMIAFISFIHRTFLVSSRGSIQEELNYIMDIDQRPCISTSYIQKIIYKFGNQLTHYSSREIILHFIVNTNNTLYSLKEFKRLLLNLKSMLLLLILSRKLLNLLTKLNLTRCCVN